MPRRPSVRTVPGYGDELRARLKTAGMTQAELVNAAHISRPTLNRALREDRISPENEAAIDSALSRRTEPKSNRRFQSRAGWARATDLVRWADFRESQAELPAIVRSLVRLTASGLTSISFRAGEGIQIEGWDGIADARGSTPFVPEGKSAWEIGTSAKIEEKAQSDYEKRTANPIDVDPGDTTFIFVTPRRWGGKNNWAKARRAEKIWKDVRVIDADDLELWLQDAPPVHLRLSRLIGTLEDGTQDLPYWWANWASSTRPSLTEAFLLAGRDEQANKVRQELSGTGVVFGVKAESRDEAIAFVAASIQTLPEETSEDYLGRAIVVEEASAWRALVTSPTRLILIPLIDVGDAVAAAVRAGHTVAVPLGGGDLGPAHTIAVPAVKRSAAADVLRKSEALASLSEHDAEVKANALARLARRSMTALRRELAVGTLRQPEWSKPAVGRLVLAALFPGGWNATVAGDRTFVESVAGKPYADAMSRLEPFSHGTDPLLRRRDALWYLVSREDAWDLLVPFVNDDDVEAFRIAATEALSGVNPQFEMEKDERWKAGLYDRKPRYSSWLRSAVAETLALIGSRWDMQGQREMGDAGLNAPSLRYVAARVVRDVFKLANADWRVWATLSELLPELAEAAPDAFLSAVEAGLKIDPSPVMELFAQEADGTFGGPAPHTGLLWALERLAWSPDQFASVVRILAELAKRDPGGRLSNRPEASLKAIFRPWMPQTSASVGRRLSVLENLSRSHEDVAWTILLSTLPEFHGVGFYAPRPQWRQWEIPSDGVRRFDYEAAVRGAIKNLLALVGTNGERWSQLIAAIAHLGSHEFDVIAQQLETITDVSAADSAAIAVALRDLVGQHRNFADADWALPPEMVDRLDALRSRFGEQDRIAGSAWLFTWHPQLTNPKAKFDDHDARDAEVEEERQRVIIDIAATAGIEGVRRLALLAEQPAMVGYSAGRSGRFRDNVAMILLQDLHAADRHRDEFAQGVARAMINANGDEWVSTTIHAMNELMSPEQKGELVSLLDPTPRAWDLAASLGPDVERAYWQRVWFVRQDEDVAYAARKMIEFGQLERAADLVGMYAHRKHVDPTLILEILQRIANGEARPELFRGNFRHHLSALFDRLYESPEISTTDVGRLEWAFLPGFQYHRDPKALNEALAHDPSFFVELVKMVFRAEDEPPKDREEISEQSKQLATRAYSVLHSWRTPPGRRDDGTIDGGVLLTWVRQAREALRAEKRLGIGDEQIGQMLSGAPADPDGTWPGEAVRAIINEAESDDLERGIAVGKFNSRGVISRSMDDGGLEDRAIADNYERLAVRVADSCPRAARLLRDMAEDHRHHGAREDREMAIRDEVEL